MTMNTHRILNIKRNSTLPQQLLLPIDCPRCRKNKAHPALFAAVYGGSVLIAIATIIIIYSKIA